MLKKFVKNKRTIIAKLQAHEIDRLNKCQSYIEVNLYMAFIKLTDDFVLEPQVSIDKYRVDFLEKNTKTVIECDGYDYHKSKEQVDSDCKRERKLSAMGYKVTRFSGVEINQNADACAKELVEILNRNKRLII